MAPKRKQQSHTAADTVDDGKSATPKRVELAGDDKKPVFLFAHGAGAGSSHPSMQKWKQLLSDLGLVHLFDYPYMAAGRKVPDPQARLISAHKQALADAEDKFPGSPVFFIGRSMGSRMGLHLATELDDQRVRGCICLGYPLVGQGGGVRDAVLKELSHPLLLVQGTRDKMCPLDQLQQVLKQIKAPHRLHVVEGGDHGLEALKGVLKSRNWTQEDSDRHALRAIADFVQDVLSGKLAQKS